MSHLPGQKWVVYEANVQQYRVLSATVQSFLLTVGAILFSSSQTVPITLLSVVALMGLAHVGWVWIPVVRCRLLIVDYYKFQFYNKLSEQKISELELFCSEKQYVEDKCKRAVVNADFFGNAELKVLRPTRWKLDLVVPCSYMAIWFFLAIWKIFRISVP